MNGRFLYIGGFQLPDKNAAAHRVLSIGKILRELDYDVTYLDVDEKDVPEHLGQKHYVEGFETYSMGYPRGIKQWFRFVTKPYHVPELLNLHDDWCGVIAYNYHSIALLRLKRLCCSLKLKLFCDLTEWYIENFQCSLRYFAVRIDTFLKMRLINKLTDGAIVISNYLEEYYKNMMIVNIPPLVDLMDLKWKSLDDSARSHQNIILTYAGAPGKHKDKLNVIVDAISKTKNHNVLLQILGVTTEEYLEMYPNDNDKVQGLICDSRLRFMGIVEHKMALDIIKRSDYTVFFRPLTLSNISGFPTKLIESISCGTPVITNKTKNLKDYWKNNQLGYFFDTEDFEERLIECLEKFAPGQSSRVVDRHLFDYHNYTTVLSQFLDIAL